MWYWRVVHYWSIVRLRRRVVLGLAAIGVLVGVIIASGARPVFSSRASVKIDGLNSDGYITNGLSPEAIKQLYYRLGTNSGSY
jgi:uncharacterized protein involved in exopolysaccharide biosynthesis